MTKTANNGVVATARVTWQQRRYASSWRRLLPPRCRRLLMRWRPGKAPQTSPLWLLQALRRDLAAFTSLQVIEFGSGRTYAMARASSDARGIGR